MSALLKFEQINGHKANYIRLTEFLKILPYLTLLNLLTTPSHAGSCNGAKLLTVKLPYIY